MECQVDEEIYVNWSYGDISATTGVRYLTMARFFHRDIHPAPRKGFCGRKHVTERRLERRVKRIGTIRL